MRLNNVLNILRNHLVGYDGLSEVEIENVGENRTTPPQSILISLIKIEEETTLRNGRHAKINQSFKMVFKNRPVQTNLYVLFSCNHTVYNNALQKLSQVVEFFQGNNIFTHLDGEDDGTGEKFKLVTELQQLSFEQINFIWSFLGGKQLPSVMYKVKMIPLEAKDKINEEGEPILEINIDGDTSL